MTVLSSFWSHLCDLFITTQTTMARPGISWRWCSLWAALVLVALWGILNTETGVNAQRVEIVEREIDVVGGVEVVAMDDPTHVKKTVTIERVAATIETTRIAGSDVHDQAAESAVPESVAALGECRAGSGERQCAPEPAETMPTQTEDEIEDKDVLVDMNARQELAVLEVMQRHLKELDDQIHVWLPKLQATVDGLLDQITQTKDTLAAKWRGFAHECVVFYNHFLADAVDALKVMYHHIAVVVSDVYSVVSAWVAVVVGKGHQVWERHEEVRIITRHVVSVLLLASLGVLFFSIYALVATVPDTVSTMWTSLDDLTRAQLKIVFVLVMVFTIYHLRSLWSFWLLAGSILTFYYWSGHVLAKTMPPRPLNARQASERMPVHAKDASSLRRTKSLV